MSFYVSLPSNSSMNLYDNTVSNYTTKLKYPIKLNGPYEVGLAEIIFDSNWDIELGFLIINTDNKILKIPLSHRDGQSYDTFLKKISENILNEYANLELEIALQKNPDITLQSITNEIFKNVPRLEYKNNQIHINSSETQKFTCEFIGLLAELLQIKNKTFSNSENIIELIDKREQFRVINTIYVYCDIIKFQYVGDTFAPLLRNVIVDSNNSTNFSVFSNPHYLPVSYSEIDNINIKILDEFGNQIRFINGRTIVKLHFRPQRYGF